MSYLSGKIAVNSNLYNYHVFTILIFLFQEKIKGQSKNTHQNIYRFPGEFLATQTNVLALLFTTMHQVNIDFAVKLFYSGLIIRTKDTCPNLPIAQAQKGLPTCRLG